MDSAEDRPCGRGCPIRRSPDHSLLAAPRGLSQRAASFIASQCQGIHQMPLSCLLSFPPCAEGRPVNRPPLSRAQDASPWRRPPPWLPPWPDAFAGQDHNSLLHDVRERCSRDPPVAGRIGNERDAKAAATGRPRAGGPGMFNNPGRRPRPGRAGSLKGGDPAAGSPTATLLRLHPSR